MQPSSTCICQGNVGDLGQSHIGCLSFQLRSLFKYALMKQILLAIALEDSLSKVGTHIESLLVCVLQAVSSVVRL